MVNFDRTVDKDGFTTQTRRRSRTSVCNPLKTYEENGKYRSDGKLRDKKNIKVERKTIGASMGKKGWRDIIHVAVWTGNRRSFCWLSFKAGVWLVRLLKMEANGGDAKLTKWNFREDEDWMLVTRENNEFGDFIRLQVSHNKEYPVTLFFPAGIDGIGWWDTSVFLEDLMSTVYQPKERKDWKEVLVNPECNVWFGPNRNDHTQPKKNQTEFPLFKQDSDQGLNSIWQRTIVVEVASEVLNFEWKEVGKWIMSKFGWSFGFELQPIDDHRAVFHVNTFAEFFRVRKFGNWKVGAVDIRIFPWFAGINAIPKPKQGSFKKQWIGIRGVPFNLWNFSTFKIIGDKFGGLVDVSPESSMATDLSEIRVLALGPVNSGKWCEELIINNKGFWVEIRIIGEVLEPSRQDLKPVAVVIDRMEPPQGHFWRCKPPPANRNEEDDVTLRGSKIMVDQTQRFNNHVSTKVIDCQLGGTDTTVPRSTKKRTRVQENLNTNSSIIESVGQELDNRGPRGFNSNLVGTEKEDNGLSKSGDNTDIFPPGFGPGAHMSSSIGLDSSSLRSLRKQLKSKMSKGGSVSNSLLSSDKIRGNASDDEVNKENHYLSTEAEKEFISGTGKLKEVDDDAASHTSGTARCKANTPVVNPNLAILLNKLKNSGNPSGIVFSKHEVSFVTNTIMAHADAFSDELVPGECEGT